VNLGALQGKLRIGNSQGPAWLGIVPVEDYLRVENMSLSDVEFQQLPIGELATALEIGAVDAAWLNSPAHLPFLGNGTANLVASYKGDVSGTAYAFGPRLLEDEPEVGQAFVRALMRTISTHLRPGYKSNSGVIKVLAERLGSPEELLRSSPELDFGTSYNPELAVAGQKLWIEWGGILSYQNPLLGSSFVDNRFINSIYPN
jgi:NitT/TauT family transport system substrate-binding protein